MKFGVYVGPRFPAGMGGSQALDFSLAIARTAWESDFDGIFVGHHYVSGPEYLMFHPLVLLSRMAAEAPDTYLGTASFLLPFHHPVEVAEATALLDIISRGRLILGVSQGYRQIEFDTLGISKSQRAKRLAEGIAALRKLWTEDRVSFEGDAYRFHNISVLPKPLQKGGPPIWVGADAEKTIARVPYIGDAWMASGRHSKTFIRSVLPAYRSSLHSTGRRYEGIPMFRELIIARNARNVDQKMKQLLTEYGDYLTWGRKDLDYRRGPDDLVRDRIIAGTPDQVAGELEEYEAEFNVPFMWFRIYWPGMETESTLASIRLFGREVIRAFR